MTKTWWRRGFDVANRLEWEYTDDVDEYDFLYRNDNFDCALEQIWAEEQGL